MANYDILGNVALAKFPREMKLPTKKRWAEKFLKSHKQISTVLEKSDKVSGRLRTLKTRFISGLKTKEALYRENDCTLRFSVESCYFSPRLSAERKELAGKVKKGEDVLVMFGGVAPFAIVIAKKSKAEKITSVELSKACNRYAKENVKRNKLNNVVVIQGNVRNKIPREEYDRIIMARPNLKDSFLDVAFRHVKSGGMIHYYGFYPESDKGEMISLIRKEAERAEKKIRIQKIKRAGEIGVRKYRYRVDLKVLN